MAEKKVPWNLRVFSSVADAFDEEIDRSHRGDKGVTVSAAMLMFLTVSDEHRQRFVDLVKLAEGRGLDGTVYEAAKKARELSDGLDGQAPSREGTESRGRKRKGLRKVGS